MTDLREDERPYTLYRSAPRSLTSRLRGETDAELEARELLMRDEPPRPPRGGDGRGGGPDGPRPPRRGWRRIPGFGPSTRPLWHPLRLLKFFVMACIFWVVLSAVLFFISAETKSGNLPGGSATEAALSSAGPMLFTPNNILILGLDVRPKTGYSSQEAGANHSEANAATDSIMIWRVGGGTSRKLSIPRDTLTYVPCGAQSGMMKINAAWACGGPQNTIHVIERLTGIKINHMVVIDFANFIKFIDDIGGVTVKTPRICSEISGGAANGGFTLNLQPGYHHLTGEQAITLARTRHNSCNPAYNDFDRQLMQQQIVNAMKGQMLSVHAFIHLPWAAWDAPGAIQTDMGGLTMMQLFIASEIGGTSNPVTLGGAFQTYNGQDVVVPSQDDIHSKVNQLMNG
ncbi:MAG: LCP family protein [Conexibacteraceae bacterium]|nr:LCP family protein [Conexibacteraceae bacterium]